MWGEMRSKNQAKKMDCLCWYQKMAELQEWAMGDRKCGMKYPGYQP
jgi:hypothetical protein